MHSRNALIHAMARELSMTTGYLPQPTLRSVYFGGGTPSVLQAAEWDIIWNALLKHYTLATDAEVTVEVNPDDITPAWLSMLRQTPANRLSIGIQSFHDEELKMMNRLHTADDAIRAVTAAQDAGFHNLTIDLMYGLPGSTFSSWEANLDLAIQLQTPHISSYSLTVEPKTALAHLIDKGSIQLPEEATAARQFLLLHDKLTHAGMEHYEISNFALPGYHAKHNSAYWTGMPYLGIGPGAHSFQGSTRRWNVSHNAQYIKAIQGGQVPAEEEQLTLADQYNEWVMIRLRTAYGVLLQDVASRFGEPTLQHFEQSAKPWLDKGYLLLRDGRATIPASHWYIADTIISELFIV